MEGIKKILIEDPSGSYEVELITYLISDDGMKTYIVYSKGETQGVENDHIIYISRYITQGDVNKIEEIVDDEEWTNVQLLLKKIANAE
jgi:hypothetical protein